MHSINLERTRQVLVPWVRAHLPECSSVRLAPLRRPEAGGSSVTLLLDAQLDERGRERHEEWVLRLQSTDYQIYENPSVERQFRVLQRLYELDAAPVPEPLWYEPDPALLGAPFYVMRRVLGDVPPDTYFQKGIFADAEPAQREAMWFSAVEAMAELHRTAQEDFAFLSLGEHYPSGLDEELAIWDSYRRWIAAEPGAVPGHAVQERARCWLEDHRPSYRPTGLAWGDARPGNMVFRDQRCVAILDWETASLGGGETDLGWWLYYDWMISDAQGVARLPGVGSREELVQTWEHCAGRRAHDLEWHEVFATWRFSLIADRAVALLLADGTLTARPERDVPAERLIEMTGA